jgi:hypothetical protein
MLINGSCHCKNISFALRCEAAPTIVPARACTCSFCTKHGAVWTALSSSSLEVSVQERAHLSRYTFDSNTAQFHVCARCGVVPLATSSIEGRLYAVVNSKTFDDFDFSQLQPAPVSFDGESERERLARRKRYWIANVEYPDSGALAALSPERGDE